MHLPAALEQWAAEHNEQLSDATLDEVRIIAESIGASPLGGIPIDEIADTEIADELAVIFVGARAERAGTLIQVVADWTAKRAPKTEPRGDVSQPTVALTPAPLEPPRVAPKPPKPPVEPAGPTFEPAPIVQPHPVGPDDRVTTTPAFLHSDRVDEEDDVRLYGPKRRWRAILGTLAGVALLAGAAVGGWYWFTQRESSSETATVDDASVTPAPTVNGDPTDSGDSSETAVPAPESSGATLPTAVPEAAPEAPSHWADTTPILNAGTAQIMASTYAVSPANRAVLTGHTAGLTGVVVSDDGRVLTSGADRRLVDWGVDVTLAIPEVLNVPTALTVLERTADQRVIAGDVDGTVTILDMGDSSQPTVINVHDVAISAATEWGEGRLAIASVDGDVAVFDIATPDDRITLPHSVEVTAMVALDDGRLATAAVDGVIRLWEPGGEGEPGQIATLDAPITALALLEDGRLASASIDGAIHIVPAIADVTEVVVLPGHVGAVRALFELTLPDGTLALASGGDDTTVRLWDVAARTQLSVLEGHGDIISGLDVLSDGRLVSTSGDRTGRVWDLTLPPSRPVIAPHDSLISAIDAWNDDQFITGDTAGKVVLASTTETSEPTEITQHDAPIVGVARLQSGDIVSLDANSVLRINQADADPAALVEISLAPGATALDVRDGQGVVTGHADGRVRFHDLTAEILSVDAHGSGVNDVVALSNGLVVSAGQDNTVRIIDFENPDQLPVFDLHTAPVDVVIELPDGRIASAGSDGIYIFTLEGLAQDHVRLNGQRSRTISLVALPGDRLISTGDDGRVRLWDLSQPEAEPTTLIDIPGIVNPYLIETDNGLLVAGAARGYVVFTPN